MIFNNMLAGMLGQLYLMKINLQQDETDIRRVVERIDAVDRQGRLAAEVIDQLLTFARKGPVRMQRVLLNRLVNDVMHLHRVSIPENIRIETCLSEMSLPVNGDAGLIQQMLLNLLTNARDALEDCVQPHISITLERFEADADYLAQHSEFSDRLYACLTVRDNGCGMDAAVMNKIFDPFFTTKEVGRGSGLGLSMTYGGMQTHGGHVLVESEPRQGACFRLYFPLLSAESIVEQMPEEPIRGSGQCILLADDQPSVLDVMCQAIKSLGYKVLTAADGEEAVQVFFRCCGEVDLAILDVVMPEKSGVEVAEILRENTPDLPIIFHTGYGEEAKLGVIQAWARCTTVKKPTSIEALSRCIAKLLR
ncbi:MAG: ATP-binding protein [Mariprofundaceae bacterium]|nr:ATP-binding protein [Mariprofundaceae bacterium]